MHVGSVSRTQLQFSYVYPCNNASCSSAGEVKHDGGIPEEWSQLSFLLSKDSRGYSPALGEIRETLE